jgi:hypothetical protein
VYTAQVNKTINNCDIFVEKQGYGLPRFSIKIMEMKNTRNGVNNGHGNRLMLERNSHHRTTTQTRKD